MILVSFTPPSNSLVLVSDAWRALWADTASFKGPQAYLVCCFQNLKESRISSAVLYKAQRSQNIGKNNQRKHQLCVCKKKPTILHLTIISNRIELSLWPNLARYSAAKNYFEATEERIKYRGADNLAFAADDEELDGNRELYAYFWPVLKSFLTPRLCGQL